MTKPTDEELLQWVDNKLLFARDQLTSNYPSIVSDGENKILFLTAIRERLLATCKENLQVQSQWRTIDSAPRDGRLILAASKDLPAPAIVFANKQEWECQHPLSIHGMGIGFYPTHWMPLPQPPEGK